MRVLILSASYGSGHNVAARSVADALEAAGASVTIVDHFRDLVHPAFDRATRALYGFMLRRAPALWGTAYGLGDRMASDSPWAFGMTRLGARRLARLLDTTAGSPRRPAGSRREPRSEPLATSRTCGPSWPPPTCW